MTIIFDISGGLGKSIMATAVLSAIRKKYRKSNIVVVSEYPEVFMSNPNVNRVIKHEQLHGIHSKYLLNKESKVFMGEPYHTSDFIMQNDHLIKIWCDMFNVEYNGEIPELFLLKSEKEYFAPFYKLDKPIFALHTNGGGIEQPLKYSWTRDIPAPVVEDVIEYFKNDYSILHIKRPDQLKYNNTFGAHDGYRSIAIAITMSSKRLFIDSSCMHLATALKMPSVVTWIGTSPKVFGYDMHTNIEANSFTREVEINHPHYQKHLLFEDISSIPYNDLREIFDSNQIIKVLKNQK